MVFVFLYANCKYACNSKSMCILNVNKEGNESMSKHEKLRSAVFIFFSPPFHQIIYLPDRLHLFNFKYWKFRLPNNNELKRQLIGQYKLCGFVGCLFGVLRKFCEAIFKLCLWF